MKMKSKNLLVLLLMFASICSLLPASVGSTIAERELARKLIKLFLAAAVLSPPGMIPGVLPFPAPFPVPIGIESMKPPIYSPMGYPFIHGGGFGHHGGYGGGMGHGLGGIGGLGGMGMGGIGGLGGMGGGYGMAASELNHVIALPVVRAGSPSANNALTKIAVTLPKGPNSMLHPNHRSYK